MNNTFGITDKDKILIVAPHPDDETLGCGGILARYAAQCDVLLLTDGGLGQPPNQLMEYDNVVMVRKKEFEEVMRFFGIERLTLLNIPDSQLDSHRRSVEGYDLRAYRYIFVPNRYERHADHKSAYRIIKRMSRRQKISAELVEYEVWSPIISPNCFCDITEVMEKKLDALKRYKSQNKMIDYVKLASALGIYRGTPHHVQYCEAFYIEPAHKRSIVKRLFRRMTMFG